MTDTTVEALDDDAPISVAETAWLRKILPVLSRHYPSYRWLVNVDVRGGVVNIGLPAPGRNDMMLPWAYTLHLDKLDDKKVIQAGGEMLERWRLSRRRAPSDPDELTRSTGIDVAGATWAPKWAKALS